MVLAKDLSNPSKPCSSLLSKWTELIWRIHEYFSKIDISKTTEIF